MPAPNRNAPFHFGVATSSYQIEGAVHQDGRGPSIWDRFCQEPGRIIDGSDGSVACDHYHRYPEDVALMRELGVSAYRFSVAWPRLFPEGRGKLNRAGLAFYDRLIDALLEAQITPFATLYHCDLPLALQERGGWLRRETALAFADYAAAVAGALGDRLRWYSTLNEPWVSAFVGHLTGEHAPGTQNLAAAVSAAHHLLLGHALAKQAVKAQGDHQVGIVLNLSTVYPGTERPEDQAAAQRVDAYHNGWFLDPLLRGSYPKIFGETPIPIQDGDLEEIQKPLDFLGVNYYRKTVVTASESGLLRARYLPGVGEVTQMNWEVSPEGLYDLLLRLGQETGGKIPLYITENGAAYHDELVGGRVDDPGRVHFLQVHLDAVQRARRDGAWVGGYFAWSLMDNFEWAYGYSRRFGIVYVDYATQKRVPKSSYAWYQRYIAEQRRLEAR